MKRVRFDEAMDRPPTRAYEWDMQPTVASTLAALACSVSGCDDKTSAVAAPAPASGAAPGPASAAQADPGWSVVVDGVRGRLVVTRAPEHAGKPQLHIDLELENVRDTAMPAEIRWGSFEDMVKFSLEDAAGRALPAIAPGGNSLAIPDYWQPLPIRAALRVPISRNAYEYVSAGRTLFRPLVFQAWELTDPPPGPLYLRATFTPARSDEANRNVWTGPLELPRVALP